MEKKKLNKYPVTPDECFKAKNAFFDTGLKMKALQEGTKKHMIQWDQDGFITSHPRLLKSIFHAMDVYKPVAQRLSADGVYFFCSNCEHKPEMLSRSDDLLKMNYCPNCGCKFESK